MATMLNGAAVMDAALVNLFNYFILKKKKTILKSSFSFVFFSFFLSSCLWLEMNHALNHKQVNIWRQVNFNFFSIFFLFCFVFFFLNKFIS